MLVDNGIVTAEEIRNRIDAGEERRAACLNTARGLSIPLLTSSLTTILAFMPIYLLTGDVGEYAFSLPIVIIILLLSSWFLSMYLTPYMCFWFMKSPGSRERSRRRMPQKRTTTASTRRTGSLLKLAHRSSKRW